MFHVLCFMIIILHGENSFLSRRKLNEIIEQYRAKHKSGLNFIVFEGTVDLFDFKAAWETVSMFSEKKLIVLKDAFAAKKNNADVLDYLKSRIEETGKDKDRVIVFSESESLEEKKNKELKWLFDAAYMAQESQNLSGAKLAEWLKQEAVKIGGKISDKEAQMLIAFCGNDLWRLSNEISKLVSYNKIITVDNIRLLAHENTEAKIFDALDALVNGDKKKSTEHFYKVSKSGEDWVRVFALIVFQFRNLLKIKALAEEKLPQAKIAEKLKMHPFVVKKLLPVVSKHSLSDLKEKYKSLLEADFNMKTGRDNFQAVLERLILES